MQIEKQKKKELCTVMIVDCFTSKQAFQAVLCIFRVSGSSHLLDTRLALIHHSILTRGENSNTTSYSSQFYGEMVIWFETMRKGNWKCITLYSLSIHIHFALRFTIDTKSASTQLPNLICYWNTHKPMLAWGHHVCGYYYTTVLNTQNNCFLGTVVTTLI